VKIADVQILFYAIDPTSERHAPAARWLEDAIQWEQVSDTAPLRSMRSTGARSSADELWPRRIL
jgi:hypothetical protein